MFFLSFLEILAETVVFEVFLEILTENSVFEVFLEILEENMVFEVFLEIWQKIWFLMVFCKKNVFLMKNLIFKVFFKKMKKSEKVWKKVKKV